MDENKESQLNLIKHGIEDGWAWVIDLDSRDEM